MTALKFLLIALFLVGIQLTVACGGDTETPAPAETDADDTEAPVEYGVEEAPVVE